MLFCVRFVLLFVCCFTVVLLFGLYVVLCSFCCLVCMFCVGFVVSFVYCFLLDLLFSLYVALRIIREFHSYR